MELSGSLSEGSVNPKLPTLNGVGRSNGMGDTVKAKTVFEPRWSKTKTI